MKRHFAHLSFTARLQIESWLKAKVPIKEIASRLGVHISTVYREIKRGEYEHKSSYTDYVYEKHYKFQKRYSPDIAQKNYQFNLAAKGAQLKIGNDFEFANYIEDKIVNEGLSPDAVLGQIRKDHLVFDTSICTTTLYSYIDKGIFGKLSLEYLHNKGKRRKTPKRKVISRAPKGTSIEKRPANILSRDEFGHWEMDCVCGKGKHTLLVLTERKTLKEIIFHMPDHKADSVIRCLNVLERKYGKMFKQVFKTITVDNGSEFAAFEAMEKSIFGHGKSKRTSVYYCHPYCSCERGSNERNNREIRRKIPKGSNIAQFSDKEISDIEHWLNNYPRRRLGYYSADELFNKELAQISV